MSELTAENVGDIVTVQNAAAPGPLVFVCEHASLRIPQVLNGLALSPDDATSHVVWDPGALLLTEELSSRFQAPAIVAEISRLVYDLNRPPEADAAYPAKSERIDIPGNAGLSSAARATREALIYHPFHDRVTALLDQRDQAGMANILVTIHSFTPVYFGEPRALDIGILHDSDPTLADLILAEAGQLYPLLVERNAPYGPEDGVTHTLRLHGIARKIPHVMVEIRNDLLQDAAGITRMADALSSLLRPALANLNIKEGAKNG